MKEEHKALALKLISCPLFRWMERMRLSDGGVVVTPPGEDSVMFAVDLDTGLRRIIACEADGPIPDLDDPATVGCLLFLLDEARPVSAGCEIGGSTGWWYAWTDLEEVAGETLGAAIAQAMLGVSRKAASTEVRDWRI